MVSFIILHYGNINDTLECIESIKKIKTKKDISIIVVDNASLNNEQIVKLKKYTDDIILLDSNLGFAKANNIGCKYAIDKYKPDFIIVSNNDIVINQSNIIDKIYNEEFFDILGPKILTDGGQSVNPFPVYGNLDEVNNRINKLKKLIKIYNSRVQRFLLRIYMSIKYAFVQKRLVYNGELKKYGVALHGCFLIFSKHYYEKYKDVFYNDTFLYHEEEFLYYRTIKDNLKTIYNPEIEVFHKEGASLNKVYNNNYKKMIFRCNEELKSLELLKKVFQENKQI